MQVDKGIPPPPNAIGRPPQGEKYPFANMKNGDSFYSTDGWKRLSNHTQAYRRKTGTSFVIRKEGDGHRVWMTASTSDLLS